MIQILMILFSLNGAWAQGHGVGNGGDGFEIRGQVYLRDLMEAGLEKTQIAAAPKDSQFLTKVNMVPVWRPFAREKLATILNQLEHVSPGAGQYLLYAIRMHTWSFVNTPLRRVDDNCDILSVPNGAFVQIANRMNGTIRINEDAWNKMSDENQIALIVHEAIYSLVHPGSPAQGKCLYASMKTREIVGLLFSEDFGIRGPQLYKDLIEPELDWPKGPLWDARTDADKWILSFLYPDSSVAYTPIPIFKQQTFVQMLNVGDMICKVAQLNRNPSSGTPFIRSRLSLRPFAGQFVKYDAGFGEQFHLRIALREGPLYQDLDLPATQEFKTCVQNLRPLMVRALNEY